MQVEFAKCGIRRHIEESMNEIASREKTREQAVEITIDMMVPIFDRLQQNRGQWIQLMRKYLPNSLNASNLSHDRDMGLCGACSSPLSYNSSVCSVRCEECQLDFPIPYGSVTLADHICPICNFPCLTIENQPGKRQPKTICPKCYNNPIQEWMIDTNSPNL